MNQLEQFKQVLGIQEANIQIVVFSISLIARPNVRTSNM